MFEDLDQAVYEQKREDDLDQQVQEAHREYRERFDQGVYLSRGDYLSRKRAREIFWRVVKAYRDTRNLSPITATPYDPDIFARKLTPDCINYLIDLENASKKVLTPGLFVLWQKLVEGKEIPERDLKEIEKLCSRIYKDRGLHMTREYFRHRHVRQWRPERRVNAITEVAA